MVFYSPFLKRLSLEELLYLGPCLRTIIRQLAVYQSN